VPCLLTAIVMILIFGGLAIYLYLKLVEESKKRAGNITPEQQRKIQAEAKVAETRKTADEILAEVRRQSAAAKKN
jgi:hypothetical protein